MKEKEEIEEWRPVKGYEGLYEISNLGNLYNLVKQNYPYKFKNYKGYIQTSLYKDKKRKTTTIHRLMAQAFISNPENKPQINHKNGIKDYNRLGNLEWCEIGRASCRERV